jgi:hypothetical protein
VEQYLAWLACGWHGTASPSETQKKEKKKRKKLKEKNIAWLASWHGTASTSQTRWLEDIAGVDMSRFKSKNKKESLTSQFKG